MTDTITTSIEKATLISTNYKDLLERRKIAKNFLEIIKVQNANVYSINAPWGSGKTWFLKFIEDECKSQKIPFVLFNVWETDYAKDPFQAILSELLNLLGQIKTKNEITKFEQELAQIRNIANKFINLRKRLSFSIGLNPQVLPISGEITVNPNSSSLAEYEEMKAIKNDFIDSLKLFVNNLDTKLIIAIDELDRCRPDYAITTLEIIKHFFNTPNVVFIFAVDKEQIHCTVKTMFGTTTDANAYLKKFVDIQYTLPQSNNNEFIRYLMKNKYPLIKQSLEKLNSKNKILRYFTTHGVDTWALYSYQDNEAITEMCNICKSINLSLRDIDKLCLKLNIILPQLALQESVLQLDFLIRLIIINIQQIKIYDRLRNLEGIPFFQHKIDEYLVGSLFEDVYKMLCNINSNPEESYYTNRELAHLASSYNNIRSYFDKIDFAEDFS